jgi:hypothetical protein
MALYIEYLYGKFHSFDKFVIPTRVCFHLGDKVEFDKLKNSSNIYVVEIQADGNELNRIESRFSGIPMVRGKRNVAWTGVFAQFIFDNLDLS